MSSIDFSTYDLSRLTHLSNHQQMEILQAKLDQLKNLEANSETSNQLSRAIDMARRYLIADQNNIFTQESRLFSPSSQQQAPLGIGANTRAARREFTSQTTGSEALKLHSNQHKDSEELVSCALLTISAALTKALPNDGIYDLNLLSVTGKGGAGATSLTKQQSALQSTSLGPSERSTSNLPSNPTESYFRDQPGDSNSLRDGREKKDKRDRSGKSDKSDKSSRSDSSLGSPILPPQVIGLGGKRTIKEKEVGRVFSPSVDTSTPGRSNDSSPGRFQVSSAGVHVYFLDDNDVCYLDGKQSHHYRHSQSTLEYYTPESLPVDPRPPSALRSTQPPLSVINALNVLPHQTQNLFATKYQDISLDSGLVGFSVKQLFSKLAGMTPGLTQQLSNATSSFKGEHVPPIVSPIPGGPLGVSSPLSPIPGPPSTPPLSSDLINPTPFESFPDANKLNKFNKSNKTAAAIASTASGQPLGFSSFAPIPTLSTPPTLYGDSQSTTSPPSTNAPVFSWYTVVNPNQPSRSAATTPTNQQQQPHSTPTHTHGHAPQVNPRLVNKDPKLIVTTVITTPNPLYKPAAGYIGGIQLGPQAFTAGSGFGREPSGLKDDRSQIVNNTQPGGSTSPRQQHTSISAPQTGTQTRQASNSDRALCPQQDNFFIRNQLPYTIRCITEIVLFLPETVSTSSSSSSNPTPTNQDNGFSNLSVRSQPPKSTPPISNQYDIFAFVGALLINRIHNDLYSTILEYLSNVFSRVLTYKQNELFYLVHTLNNSILVHNIAKLSSILINSLPTPTHGSAVPIPPPQLGSRERDLPVPLQGYLLMDYIVQCIYRIIPCERIAFWWVEDSTITHTIGSNFYTPIQFVRDPNSTIDQDIIRAQNQAVPLNGNHPQSTFGNLGPNNSDGGDQFHQLANLTNRVNPNVTKNNTSMLSPMNLCNDDHPSRKRSSTLNNFNQSQQSSPPLPKNQQNESHLNNQYHQDLSCDDNGRVSLQFSGLTFPTLNPPQSVHYTPFVPNNFTFTSPQLSQETRQHNSMRFLQDPLCIFSKFNVLSSQLKEASKIPVDPTVEQNGSKTLICSIGAIPAQFNRRVAWNDGIVGKVAATQEPRMDVYSSHAEQFAIDFPPQSPLSLPPQFQNLRHAHIFPIDDCKLEDAIVAAVNTQVIGNQPPPPTSPKKDEPLSAQSTASISRLSSVGSLPPQAAYGRSGSITPTGGQNANQSKPNIGALNVSRFSTLTLQPKHVLTVPMIDPTSGETIAVVQLYNRIDRRTCQAEHYPPSLLNNFYYSSHFYQAQYDLTLAAINGQPISQTQSMQFSNLQRHINSFGFFSGHNHNHTHFYHNDAYNLSLLFPTAISVLKRYQVQLRHYYSDRSYKVVARLTDSSTKFHRDLWLNKNLSGIRTSLKSMFNNYCRVLRGLVDCELVTLHLYCRTNTNNKRPNTGTSQQSGSGSTAGTNSTGFNSGIISTYTLGESKLDGRTVQPDLDLVLFCAQTLHCVHFRDMRNQWKVGLPSQNEHAYNLLCVPITLTSPNSKVDKDVVDGSQSTDRDSSLAPGEHDEDSQTFTTNTGPIHSTTRSRPQRKSVVNNSHSINLTTEQPNLNGQSFGHYEQPQSIAPTRSTKPTRAPSTNTSDQTVLVLQFINKSSPELFSSNIARHGPRLRNYVTRNAYEIPLISNHSDTQSISAQTTNGHYTETNFGTFGGNGSLPDGIKTANHFMTPQHQNHLNHTTITQTGTQTGPVVVSVAQHEHHVPANQPNTVDFPVLNNMSSSMFSTRNDLTSHTPRTQHSNNFQPLQGQGSSQFQQGSNGINPRLQNMSLFDDDEASRQSFSASVYDDKDGIEFPSHNITNLTNSGPPPPPPQAIQNQQLLAQAKNFGTAPTLNMARIGSVPANPLTNHIPSGTRTSYNKINVALLHQAATPQHDDHYTAYNPTFGTFQPQQPVQQGSQPGGTPAKGHNHDYGYDRGLAPTTLDDGRRLDSSARDSLAFMRNTSIGLGPSFNTSTTWDRPPSLLPFGTNSLSQTVVQGQNQPHTQQQQQQHAYLADNAPTLQSPAVLLPYHTFFQNFTHNDFQLIAAVARFIVESMRSLVNQYPLDQLLSESDGSQEELLMMHGVTGINTTRDQSLGPHPTLDLSGSNYTLSSSKDDVMMMSAAVAQHLIQSPKQPNRDFSTPTATLRQQVAPSSSHGTAPTGGPMTLKTPLGTTIGSPQALKQLISTDSQARYQARRNSIALVELKTPVQQTLYDGTKITINPHLVPQSSRAGHYSTAKITSRPSGLTKRSSVLGTPSGNTLPQPQIPRQDSTSTIVTTSHSAKPNQPFRSKSVIDGEDCDILIPTDLHQSRADMNVTNGTHAGSSPSPVPPDHQNSNALPFNEQKDTNTDLAPKIAPSSNTTDLDGSSARSTSQPSTADTAMTTGGKGYPELSNLGALGNQPSDGLTAQTPQHTISRPAHAFPSGPVPPLALPLSSQHDSFKPKPIQEVGKGLAEFSWRHSYSLPPKTPLTPKSRLLRGFGADDHRRSGLIDTFDPPGPFSPGLDDYDTTLIPYTTIINANTSCRFPIIRLDVPQVGHIFASDQLVVDVEDHLPTELLSADPSIVKSPGSVHYGTSGTSSSNFDGDGISGYSHTNNAVAQTEALIHSLSTPLMLQQSEPILNVIEKLTPGVFTNNYIAIQSQYTYITEFDPFSLPLPAHFNIAWPLQMFVGEEDDVSGDNTPNASQEVEEHERIVSAHHNHPFLPSPPTNTGDNTVIRRNSLHKADWSPEPIKRSTSKLSVLQTPRGVNLDQVPTEDDISGIQSITVGNQSLSRLRSPSASKSSRRNSSSRSDKHLDQHEIRVVITGDADDRLGDLNISTNQLVEVDSDALQTPSSHSNVNTVALSRDNGSPRHRLSALNNTLFQHAQKALKSQPLHVRFIASLYSPFTSSHVSKQLSPFSMSNTLVDHFQFLPMDLCVAIYNTFISLGFLQLFNCHYTTLQGLILCICSLYRANSFHNFKHAFSVFQFCYVLLVHTGIESRPTHAIRQHLRNGRTRIVTQSSNINQADRLRGEGWMIPPFQACLVLLASLCHDIDHPGNTNQYEASTFSRLALLHNNKSILENHHCMITILLLQQPQVNVLKFLPLERQMYARKFIIECILATDMEHHFPTISKLAALQDVNELSLNNIYCPHVAEQSPMATTDDPDGDSINGSFDKNRPHNQSPLSTHAQHNNTMPLANAKECPNSSAAVNPGDHAEGSDGSIGGHSAQQRAADFNNRYQQRISTPRNSKDTRDGTSPLQTPKKKNDFGNAELSTTPTNNKRMGESSSERSVPQSPTEDGDRFDRTFVLPIELGHSSSTSSSNKCKLNLVNPRQSSESSLEHSQSTPWVGMTPKTSNSNNNNNHHNTVDHLHVLNGQPISPSNINNSNKSTPQSKHLFSTPNPHRSTLEARTTRGIQTPGSDIQTVNMIDVVGQLESRYSESTHEDESGFGLISSPSFCQSKQQSSSHNSTGVDGSFITQLTPSNQRLTTVRDSTGSVRPPSSASTGSSSSSSSITFQEAQALKQLQPYQDEHNRQGQLLLDQDHRSPQSARRDIFDDNSINGSMLLDDEDGSNFSDVRTHRNTDDSDDDDMIGQNTMVLTSVKTDQAYNSLLQGGDVASQAALSLTEVAHVLQSIPLVDGKPNPHAVANPAPGPGPNSAGLPNTNHGLSNGIPSNIISINTTTADITVIKTLAKPKADKAKEEKDWLFLSQLFIHTADLCGQLLPLELALKWEKCISEEFSQQGCMERAQNLTPLPFLNDLHFLYNRSKGQVGFVSFVLLPWWIQLARLFPTLGQYHRQCEDNKNHYQAVQQTIERIRVEKANQWHQEQLFLQQKDPSRVLQPYVHVPISKAPVPPVHPPPPFNTDPNSPLSRPCKHHGKWVTIVPHKDLAHVFPFLSVSDVAGDGTMGNNNEFQREQYQLHLQIYGNDVLSDRILPQSDDPQMLIALQQPQPLREGEVLFPRGPQSCGFHQLAQRGARDDVQPFVIPEQEQTPFGPVASNLVVPQPIQVNNHFQHAPRFVTIWQCCHQLQPIPIEYVHEEHGE